MSGRFAAAGLALALLAGAPAAGPDFAALLVLAYDPPKPAPAFALPDLEGKAVHLTDFHGQVVWLFFWATW